MSRPSLMLIKVVLDNCDASTVNYSLDGCAVYLNALFLLFVFSILLTS